MANNELDPRLLDGFAQVPNAVLLDNKLSPMARLLYAVLASHDWATRKGKGRRRKGVVWPSQERLAALLGCSTRTVRRCLAELERHGYIRIDYAPGGVGGGGHARYTLTPNGNGKERQDTGVLSLDKNGQATGHPCPTKQKNYETDNAKAEEPQRR